jgi:hypothetical protein
LIGVPIPVTAFQTPAKPARFSSSLRC